MEDEDTFYYLFDTLLNSCQDDKFGLALNFFNVLLAERQNKQFTKHDGLQVIYILGKHFTQDRCDIS